MKTDLKVKKVKVAVFCLYNHVNMGSIRLAIALSREGFVIYGNEEFFREMASLNDIEVRPLESYHEAGSITVLVDYSNRIPCGWKTFKIHPSLFDSQGVCVGDVARAICLGDDNPDVFTEIHDLFVKIQEHHRIKTTSIQFEEGVAIALNSVRPVIDRFRLSHKVRSFIEARAQENPDGVFADWFKPKPYPKPDGDIAVV